ncbi:aldehyde ferredoxin oxidoreductase family protein [Candidatus Contubernalis alkaliaceticus]|uniref:aldehyde ferredoxin oxidoreductase family protein n=1 Tax=Candidatus Contubernalis alkaliaceticus TaxID=338645 RepID=UPI001F4C12EC|nr:aldehyde ferredoxin oxidoreductase family protein [Candidatus Contubernalis alkalaceticus]UNC91551.1 aldehyde ferredoxin oxidoreductase family protein [Candidatus Contubernalis alkalaceticus]
MLKGGYKGKILRLNLTTQTFSLEDTTEEMAKNYIGGAGFGINILMKEVSPTADPLGEENKLIFAPGPFTGTNVPCASRIAAVAKSPLTGAIGMASSGGYFPAEVKFAGYDVIIIEGKAEKPVYVYINEDKISFRSAEQLWGTKTFDCQQMIKNDLGDQNIRVACIGPAGENMVKYSCIINERRAFGRKGLGAVMGSKNLKAIAVRGQKEVAINDKDAYKTARSVMNKAMKESHVLYSMFSNAGTPCVVDLAGELGILPTRNWSDTGEWIPVDKLGLEANNEKKIGREHCYKCPVGCSQMKLARGGRYAGMLTEGPEFESIYSLGSTLGIDDLDVVITADRVCDELGLDTISAGVVVGFAMECYEKGLLTKEDTGGVELKFGNDIAFMDLLLDITYRRGLGDLLAEGTKIAAAKIGGGSEKFAMHVKGLEMPGYDVRGAKAQGLNYATSYTGADHNRGYAFQEIFGIPIPEEVDRFAYEGKGKLTKWNQDVRAVTCDCATMCAFILDMAVPGIATQNTASLLEAISGLKFTAEDVQTVGERLNNVAKVYNTAAGLTRQDDNFPERIMNEPLKDGNSKGECISQENLDIMLNEYYEARGWTNEGVPTEEKLRALGLDDLIGLLQDK